MKRINIFRFYLIVTLTLFTAFTFAQTRQTNKITKYLNIVSTDYIGDGGYFLLEFDYTLENPNDVLKESYNEVTKKLDLAPDWSFDESNKAHWISAVKEIQNDIDNNIGAIKIGQTYKIVFAKKPVLVEDEAGKKTTIYKWLVTSMDKVLPPTPVPASSANVTDPRAKVLITYLNQLIAKNAKGTLYLKSFKKVDGVESNINGVPHYSLDYTMEIEFLNNAYLNVLKLGSGDVWFDFTVNAPYGLRERYNILSSNYSYVKGDVIKFTRTANFIKKESGWKINNDGLRGYTLGKFNY